MTLPPLMTVAEVAAYLRCDPSTVREMIREGHLSAFKLRSHYRVDSWPHVGGPRTRRRRVGITAGITGGAS